MHCNRLFIYARSSKFVVEGVEGANSGGKKCVKCVLMQRPNTLTLYALTCFFKTSALPLGAYVLNGSPLRQLVLDRFKSSDIKHK